MGYARTVANDQLIAADTNADSVDEIRLGLTLGELPWRYHGTRRRKSKSGLFRRVRSALAGARTQTSLWQVRGDSVAVGYLLHALAHHSRKTRCHFFAAPAVENTARSDFSHNRERLARSRAPAIMPLRALLGGIDNYRLNAWFDPGGIHPWGIRIRQSFSKFLYPVTTLTHGLSLNRMLHEDYLPILLSGAVSCDSLVCTSRASQAAVRQILDYVKEEFDREYGTALRYGGRLDRIPLCVDTDALKPREKRPVRRRLDIPAEALVVLYLGFISLIKADLAPLLRLWQALVSERPSRQMLFIIAGTGEPRYQQWLAAYAKGLGVAKHVCFMTDISDATKESLIPAADILVLPSDTVMESFGLVPVEAMACGIPQVVADWDGYKDTVISGETGFRVPTRWSPAYDFDGTAAVFGWVFDHEGLGQSVSINLHALKEALGRLIDNDELRQNMGLNSRRRAESLYSQQAVVRNYEDLWAELSAIARTLSPPVRQQSYAEPNYFRCFRHYCSALIDDSDALALTSFGKRVMDGRVPIPVYPRLCEEGLLDTSLLVQILLEVKQQMSDSTGATVRGILRSLSKGGNVGRTKRHLMWLVKQGLLE